MLQIWLLQEVWTKKITAAVLVDTSLLLQMLSLSADTNADLWIIELANSFYLLGGEKICNTSAENLSSAPVPRLLLNWIMALVTP